MTSNANDLTERLRRRLESEREAIEELTASELERLGANSRRVPRNVLHTIEADTAVATGRMRALLLKAWLRPLVVGLSLWLGICGGKLGDGAMAVGAHPGPDRDGRRPRLWSIEEVRQNPGRGSRRPPWGSRFGSSRGSGSWWCRPARSLIRPWTVDTRPAVKLSNE